MAEAISIDAVKAALADSWGEEAAGAHDTENKIYIRFVDEVSASLMVDCDRGLVHCLVDLPDRFPRSLLPETYADLCVRANEINVTLTDVFGVIQQIQVRDQALQLADLREFAGAEDVVDICTSLAQDNISLMQDIVKMLIDVQYEAEEEPESIPENMIPV